MSSTTTGSVPSRSRSQIRVKDVMQWLYMPMVCGSRAWSITLTCTDFKITITRQCVMHNNWVCTIKVKVTDKSKKCDAMAIYAHSIR